MAGVFLAALRPWVRVQISYLCPVEVELNFIMVQTALMSECMFSSHSWGQWALKPETEMSWKSCHLGY